MTMCEAFFMIQFGRVKHGRSKTGAFHKNVQAWISKVQGDLKSPEKWVIANHSLPTKESEHRVLRFSTVTLNGYYRRARKILAPDLECWVCGDSRKKAADNKSEVEIYTKNALFWCESCKSYMSKHKTCKGMNAWKSYLFPSPPRCSNCKNEHGPTLAFLKGQTSWEDSFRCKICQARRGTYLNGSRPGIRPEREEKTWLPHLRRKYRCQHCGAIEGDDGVVFGPSHKKTYIICQSCDKGGGGGGRMASSSERFPNGARMMKGLAQLQHQSPTGLEGNEAPPLPPKGL